MSSSISATLGRREERVTVRGQTWRLVTFRLRTVLRLEQELQRWRGDLVRRAALSAADVPEDQRPLFWREAFAAARASDGPRSVEDMLAGLPEPIQLAAAAWLYLQEHHADQVGTLEAAVDWIDDAIAEGTIEAVNAALAALAPAGAGKKGAPTTGRRSSASAPSASDGNPKPCST